MGDETPALRCHTSDGNSFEGYLAFRGIPYAEPPLSERRFRDPEPREPWDEPIDGSEFAAKCPQVDPRPGRGAMVGSEDCLFLNVFTPRIPARADRVPPASSLVPVMIYIHGGDWVSGSGNIDPGPLVDKGVVVVSMNYRLGPLGFLNLGNQYISGNQGMKDQLAAMQWVRKNIYAFGGDPERVTIFGEGAGGSSVHLHMLSPLGEGLYRNGIAQSGNALSRLLEARRRGVTEAEATRYLEHTECNLGGETEVVGCLQQKTVSNLFDNPVAEGDEAANGRNGLSPFRHVPTIDYSAELPFMPQHPYVTMKTGSQKDLPFIIGITKDDGGYRLSKMWEDLKEEGEDWKNYGPNRLLDIPFDKISEYDKLLAQVIRHFYLGPNPMEAKRENSRALMNMFTDAVYRSPTNKILELLDGTRENHLFSYEIAHKPSKSHLEDFEAMARDDENDNAFAVVHGDDLLYIFDNIREDLDGAISSDEDKKARKAVVNMWTNFAKYEDPTPYRNPNFPPWEPYDKVNRAYLAIGPKPTVKRKSHNEAMYFWERHYWQDIDSTFTENYGRNSIESRAASKLLRQPVPVPAIAQAQSREGYPISAQHPVSYSPGHQPVSYNFMPVYQPYQFYKQMNNHGKQ